MFQVFAESSDVIIEKISFMTQDDKDTKVQVYLQLGSYTTFPALGMEEDDWGAPLFDGTPVHTASGLKEATLDDVFTIPKGEMASFYLAGKKNFLFLKGGDEFQVSDDAEDFTVYTGSAMKKPFKKRLAEANFFGGITYCTYTGPTNAPAPTGQPVTTPSPTSIETKTLVCGRGDMLNRPCEEGLESTAAIDTVHEVRCCRDCEGLNCLKPWKQKCDYDPNLFARSKYAGVCKVGTFVEALDFCRSMPGDTTRLCSPDELKNSCAKGTGCKFDKELVWSCAPDQHACSTDAECCGSCNTISGKCEGEFTLFPQSAESIISSPPNGITSPTMYPSNRPSLTPTNERFVTPNVDTARDKSKGVMFSITAKSKQITITGLGLLGSNGRKSDVSIYYQDGSYDGFYAFDEVNWNQVFKGKIKLDPDEIVVVNLDDEFTIPASGTVSLYVSSTKKILFQQAISNEFVEYAGSDDFALNVGASTRKEFQKSDRDRMAEFAGTIVYET